MRMNGLRLEHAEEHRALYPVPLGNTPFGLFHADTFLRVCEWRGYTLQGKIISTDLVMFTHPADRDVFTRWFKRYVSWFGNEPERLNTALFPRPQRGRISKRSSGVIYDLQPETDRYHFTVVGLGGAPDFRPERMEKAVVADWAWIAAHCQHPVYRIPCGWLFASVDEMMLFELTGDGRRETKVPIREEAIPF